MKRLVVFSSLLFALGLLGLASYVARELIAVLIVCTVGFTALLLVGTAGVVAHKIAQGSTSWLRIRAPQWNQAGREWVTESALSLHKRHLQRRWTRRIPVVAAVGTTHTD